MALNGNAGSAPVAGAVPYTDLSTAYNAVIGILAAVHARARTGEGQHVDVAMFDTALANLSYHGLQYLVTGDEPPLTPERTARPRGRFETADGAIVIIVTGARMFAKFCRDVVDRPDWIDDPRWSDEAFRIADRTTLLPDLEAIFSRAPTRHWVERCERAGIPCGAVRSVSEALSSDEARDQKLVFGLPHPTAGLAPAIAHGFRLSETPFRYAAPPLLGEHADEVLGALEGYDAERIAALAASGVIGTPRPR